MLKEQKNQVFVFGIVAILGISLATPVAKAELDIEMIDMCSQKDHLDGTPYSNPWRFEVWIDLVDPGTLHHIDVTLPAGGTPFTIYEDDGHWDYESWPTTYPTLTALQAIYPTGLYTFDFRDSSGSLIKSVQLNYSGIDEPGSPVDFTYPSYNGQTGISTNPTLTWTVNSGAGHALGMAFKADDVEIYNRVLGTMETLSWQPGPLEPEQNCWLYVTVVRIKDWAGGPGWPTKTVGGDEFEYLLHIGYCNKIGFTTGLLPAIDATIDILADTITLKTKWITCHIWPPAGYNVADIKPDSILLEGGILAVRPSIRKKKQILVAKFPASDLNLQTGPRELFVRGELNNGIPFVGSDFVTVVTKGGKKN